LAEACTDARWQAIHGNPGVPTPRPANADPGALDPAAAPAVFQTHKDQLRACQGHCEARAALRDAVLRSISEADTGNLRDVDAGIGLVSANDVIAAMVASHGTFSEVDVGAFLTSLDTKLASLDSFDTHVSSFRSNLQRLWGTWGAHGSTQGALRAPPLQAPLGKACHPGAGQVRVPGHLFYMARCSCVVKSRESWTQRQSHRRKPGKKP
jgi:hypothetical protein